MYEPTAFFTIWHLFNLNAQKELTSAPYATLMCFIKDFSFLTSRLAEI